MNLIGIFSNFSIIFFADPEIATYFTSDQRWIILFVMQNIALIFVFHFNLNFLPNWFYYTERAKIEYLSY